ncbi:aminoglycoside phosphotransferase (APT) family kinase protein [Litorimonas taeanensis]|uniref:Aminoglycoside phosphotransferase (APT) family kinase protein n=1 Tax=Litorimonas taeanensis TaxID=568099 RepID=A0A420WJX4_9PROT|nr:phosphotransferase family protein [Litorimonas taeanensis]RKQ71331.1 aminoglycoside phosphotransferase (APT) family kinase protein [Litorimonas taeanensis]
MSAENLTVDVRKGEELNIAAVEAALKTVLPDLSGEAKVTQYPSGASNLTYALDYPDRRLVLRRPPFGDKPKSGHDMHREYRVMTALKGHVPVPETVFYTDDTAIIGAEFYVMNRSEGPLVHKTIPGDWNWGEKEGRALCENFFQTLVDMHSVDYKAVGLGDFGKPEGYVNRQITGWNRRFEAAWTDDVEKFEDVQEWLINNMPAKERGAAIIHGDYRIDNCILKDGDPTQIEAILDWEISALGDPMMDLGNTLAYWIHADDPPFMQMMIRQPSVAPGMMRRQEILDFYAEKTGANVSGFQFYYVYGIWRLAVIIQQIYARFYRGQNDNPRFKDYGQMTTALGQLARLKIKTGEL